MVEEERVVITSYEGRLALPHKPRFVNDYLVPGVMLASCLIPGPHQVATIPAAYGMVAVRLAPVIGRVALAYGTVDAYNKATTFLKEKAKHGGQNRERVGTTGYKEGSKWEGMKSVDDPAIQNKFGKIKKEAFGGGQMRSDGDYLYRFDPGHKNGKVHLEVYEKVRNGVYRAVRECDPNTGDTIAGSIARMAERPVIKW